MIDRRRFLQNAAIAAAATVSAPLSAARRSDDSGSGATYEPDTLPANPEDAARYRPPYKLGAGTTQLGNIFKITPDAQAEAMLEAQWQTGVRYFDTSPWYGLGLSERRLGHFLDDKNPDDYVLSTKVGRLLIPDASVDSVGNWKGDLNFDYRYDYTAAGVRRSVEDSLQRLGVPKIDIVYIHDLAPSNTDFDDWREQLQIAIDGAMPELTRMREEGMIKAWGMGVNDIEPAVAALDAADPDVILQATEYSLVKHEDALDRLFPRVREKNASVVIGAPYNAGFLAGVDRWHYGGEMPEGVMAKRDRLRAVAKAHDVDLRTAALQFTAAPDVVSATIPGARNAEQARENAASMRASIPAAFWDELKSEGLIAESAPTPS
ncbi:L-fucose dehydrogenase [Salinisphaera orenii MK-B5]|uniref:L-fucose dehydrogenase n=1 Tax=Salinisphaera orenii MK-B5 TaxID=856730 RepID=A0A423PXF8_9GAMM|nr:aldo/keto reductase [Salinisphaera orenii]ROO30298.1 L-fucose dehydrogenase [Salinisphaera orenii MK-B5]